MAIFNSYVKLPEGTLRAHQTWLGHPPAVATQHDLPGIIRRNDPSPKWSGAIWSPMNGGVAEYI